MSPTGGGGAAPCAASTRGAAAGANLAKWRALLQKLPTATTVNEFLNDDWWTALHMACKGGNREVGLVLLETGADINAPTREKRYTPLMVACYYGRVELVHYLLAKGADVARTDVDGNTALDIAFARGKPEEVQAEEGDLGSLACAAVLSVQLRTMLPHPACHTIAFEASLRCLLDKLELTRQLDLAVYTQRMRKNKVKGAVRAVMRVKNAPRPKTPLSRDRAAARIQRAHRCARARAVVSRLRHAASAAKAVLVLQRGYRCYRARKELGELRAAKAEEEVDSLFASTPRDGKETALASADAEAQVAAVRIQCAWRCHAARREHAYRREVAALRAAVDEDEREEVRRRSLAELHVDPDAAQLSTTPPADEGGVFSPGRRQTATALLMNNGGRGRLQSLGRVVEAQRAPREATADSNGNPLDPSAAAPLPPQGLRRRNRRRSAAESAAGDCVERSPRGLRRRRSSMARRASRRQSAMEFAALDTVGEHTGGARQRSALGRRSSMAGFRQERAVSRCNSAVGFMATHGSGGRPGSLASLCRVAEAVESNTTTTTPRAYRRQSALDVLMRTGQSAGGLASLGKVADLQSLAQTLNSNWGSSKEGELRDLQDELAALVGLEVLEKLCPSEESEETEESSSYYSSDDSLDSALFMYDGQIDFFYDGEGGENLPNPADEAQFQHAPPPSDIGGFFRRLYQHTAAPSLSSTPLPSFRLFLDEYYRLRGFGCALPHKAAPIPSVDIEHSTIKTPSTQYTQAATATRTAPPATWVEVLARLTPLEVEDTPSPFSVGAFFEAMRARAKPAGQYALFHTAMDMWEGELKRGAPEGLDALVQIQRDARAVDAVEREKVYAEEMRTWKRVRMAARKMLQRAARCLIAKVRTAALRAARAEAYRLEDEAAARQEALAATEVLQRFGRAQEGRADAFRTLVAQLQAERRKHLGFVKLEEELMAARNAHVSTLSKVDKQAYYVQEHDERLMLSHRIRVMEIEEECTSGRGGNDRECFWGVVRHAGLSIVQQEINARERLALQFQEDKSRAWGRYQHRMTLISLYFFVRLQIAQKHYRVRGELFEEIKRGYYYFFEGQDRGRIQVRAAMNAERFGIYFATIIEREEILRDANVDEQEDVRKDLKLQEQNEKAVRLLEQEQREAWEALFLEEDDTRQMLFARIASDMEIVARCSTLFTHEVLARTETEDILFEALARIDVGIEQWVAREAATAAKYADLETPARECLAVEEQHAYDVILFDHAHYVDTAALVDSLAGKRTALLGGKFLPPLEAMQRRYLHKEERLVRLADSLPYEAVTRSCEVWYEERAAYLDACHGCLNTLDAAVREEHAAAWFAELKVKVARSPVFPYIQEHERKVFVANEAAMFAELMEEEAVEAAVLQATCEYLRGLYDAPLNCIRTEVIERGILMHAPIAELIEGEEASLRSIATAAVCERLLALTHTEETAARVEIDEEEIWAWCDLLRCEMEGRETAARGEIRAGEDEWTIEAEIYFSNLCATADAIFGLFVDEPHTRALGLINEDTAWELLDGMFLLQRREIVDRESTHDQHDAWHAYFMANLDRPPMRKEMIRHLVVVLYGSYLYRSYYTRLQRYAARRIYAKKMSSVLYVDTTLRMLRGFYTKLATVRKRNRAYRTLCRRHPQTVSAFRPMVVAYFRQLRRWRGFAVRRRRWPGLSLLEDSNVAVPTVSAAGEASSRRRSAGGLAGEKREGVGAVAGGGAGVAKRPKRVVVHPFRDRGTGPHDPAVSTPRHGTLVRKDPTIGRSLFITTEGVVSMVEKRHASRLSEARRQLQAEAASRRDKAYRKGAGLAWLAAAAARELPPDGTAAAVQRTTSGGYSSVGARRPSSTTSSQVSRKPVLHYKGGLIMQAAAASDAPPSSARSAATTATAGVGRPPVAPPVGKHVHVLPPATKQRSASGSAAAGMSGLPLPKPQLLQDHLGERSGRRGRAVARAGSDAGASDAPLSARSRASSQTRSVSRSRSASLQRHTPTATPRSTTQLGAKRQQAASASPQRVGAGPRRVPPQPLTREVVEPDAALFQQHQQGAVSPASDSVAVHDLLAMDVDDGSSVRTPLSPTPVRAGREGYSQPPVQAHAHGQAPKVQRMAVPEPESPITRAALSALRALASLSPAREAAPQALPPTDLGEAPASPEGALPPLRREHGDPAPPAVEAPPVVSPPSAPLAPVRHRSVSPHERATIVRGVSGYAPPPAAVPVGASKTASAIPAGLAYNRLTLRGDAGATAPQPGRLGGAPEADLWLQGAWGGPTRDTAAPPPLARAWEAGLPWEKRGSGSGSVAAPPAPYERGDFRVMLNPLPKAKKRPLGGYPAGANPQPPRDGRRNMTRLPPMADGDAHGPGGAPLSALALSALENLQQRREMSEMLQPLQVAPDAVLQSFEPPTRPEFGLNDTIYGAPRLLDTAV